MDDSYSVEVSLDAHRWEALEAVLKKQGTNIESYLQDYLLELYREMVPADQMKAIDAVIRQEVQKAQQKQETQKSFSVFRLWEGGKCQCMATEFPQDILETAFLLHQCLGESEGRASAFAQKIRGGYEISPERFDLLAQEWLRTTGYVAEVFDLDFDRQMLTTVDLLLDDWTSYWFQDVYAAVDAALCEKHCTRAERLNKLMEQLVENECFDQGPSTPLQRAQRELQPGDLLFPNRPGHRGRRLNFLVECASDAVQMEVFSPEVRHDELGSWLDISVSYDAARQEVQDYVSLRLYRNHGLWERDFRYDLTPGEQNLLKAEMEAHCQKRYGKTLNDLYAEELRQAGKRPPELKRESRRLDLEQVFFEGDISECSGKLSFYVPVTFDPDAVFGTHVASESNDDWLNIYADFDLETGEPEKALTVVLICSDGHEFEFSYSLNAAELEQLREKMEDYCQTQTGMSLDDYRQELLSETRSSDMEQRM